METSSIAIPSRLEAIRAHKERGGLIAAVLPIHYPRALLRAYDFLPVEVWGPPRVDTSYGTAHLQPYVCSIVRNALSFLQTGGLDTADLLIVPHACDSLQGLGSLLLDFVRPRQPVLPLYLPRGKRNCDVDFLSEELHALAQRLAHITGRRPSDAELMYSIQREEAADQLLAELHKRRAELPLADGALYRLIRAREYVPAEGFCQLANQALAQARPGARAGIGLLLSGIVPEPTRLLDAIDEMGGSVVADDLACCGRRLYPPGTSQDALRRLAESLLNAPPDPTRGSPIRERLDHLLGWVDSSAAKGVIFYGVKFCEPELFDLPQLQAGLQQAGIPSLAIEADVSDELSTQTLTRLQAFLETLA